ncbi:MAG TPA: hypothetical protein VFX22_00455, partial [Candidatus Kapabacteria bacterium]|nr:hypothetical protein [Candidatus Kapabacteria bacterium]
MQNMQNEDKSKLEERVIAYFDGSLDSEGSRSLLREVAESPEKRALFKAHETLSRLIVAARAPMEAPLEVKRSIAERIPGMLAFIPGLLGTAETAPIISQNANPFLAFFARMSLTTAVSIGSVVALLTAGIILKNNFDNQPARMASSKIAAAGNPMVANTPLTRLPVQSSLPTHLSNKTYVANRAARAAHETMREGVPSVAAPSNDDNKQINSDIATITQPLSLTPVSSTLANIPTIGTESLLPLLLVPDEGIAIRPY